MINNIRKIRENQQMTQTELAQQAGLSQNHLSQIESGKRKGKIEYWVAISKVLNVKLEKLLQ
jgi:transcriptional regulator with XRE-family HTH domain